MASSAQRAPAGSSGQPSRGTGGSPPVTSSPARPPSVVRSRSSAPAASASPGHDDGVGHPAQRRGQRHLVTRVDGEPLGDRLQDPGQPRAEHGGSPVDRGEAEREGVAARLPGGAVAFGGALGGGEIGDGRGGGGVGRDRVLVRGDQGDVGVVLLGDRGPPVRQLPPGHLGALGGLRRSEGQPLDLGLSCGDPRPCGRDLAGEAGQPLPPVGQGSGGGDPGAFGLGEIGLQPAALGDDAGQPGALGLQPDGELGLVGRDPVGLGVQLVGVATSGGSRRGGRQVPGPLPRQRRDAAEPLGEGGEPVPGLRRRGEPRRALGQTGLQLRLPPGDLGEVPLHRGPALPGRGLVRDVLVQGVAQLDEVVGQQAQPGVAQVGLDPGRPPGHLGLPAQRLQLAAQLGGEVGQPVEVGLHPVELAERLLLALAVLEDAGRLLDEGAAVLGAAGEDGVELALAHDDVHLAADAGVAEQLLHVEQAHLVAVDLVLALTGAVHAPGDRHLGVGDRQRAVGVVDGQRHLGAAQGRAAGGAGEDDVLHLAAAQALRALLAEDPGDGVDDVGLARPVGADDGGDAGLQPERRRGREGLEALERQAGEVHRTAT